MLPRLGRCPCRRAPLAVAVTALALVAGCAGGGRGAGDAGRDASGRTTVPSTSSSAPASATASVPQRPRVYVAVGASETVGVGADDPATQAWPRVLQRTALPDARLVDVGVSGSTVGAALTAQLPTALAERPDVVTVWLAVNDALAGIAVPRYERQLGRLVHALRRGGRTEVLVGNVPDLWRLPAYRACLPGGGSADGVGCALPYVPPRSQVKAEVAAYNAAVRRVVRAEGAVLVDLSREDDLAGLTSADGFHPSTAGHREIAAAFARRLPR